MTHDPDLTSTQTLSLQKSKAYTEDNFLYARKSMNNILTLAQI